MRVRFGLVCLAALALAGAPGAGAAAPAPPLAGVWAWSDLDESLANPRNPRRAVVTVRRGRATIRFGRGPAARLRLSRDGRTFRVVVRRLAGRRGKDRVRVRYTGRVRTGPGGRRVAGRLDILSPRYPGLSAFSARPAQRG